MPDLIQPGDLDRRVEIFAPRNTVDPVSGGTVTTYRPVATVWAKRQDASARAYQSGGTRQRQADKIFTIRFYQGLTGKHLLTCEAESFEIVGEPLEVGGRRRFMEIHAVTRNPPALDP